MRHLGWRKARSRLEQSLSSQERTRYDLAAVVRGCVEGYRVAYPQARFELALPERRVEVEGAPDLAAQLLDKLVENVLGTYSLPFSVALNVRVNGVDRLAPMAVEEPSVVAAASNAA